MKLLLENWRGYIEEESQIEREGSRKKLKPAKVDWFAAADGGWQVNAQGWQMAMEKGDWFDEPDEETLRSVTILNQKVRGSEEIARGIIRDKLKLKGYVEDEEAYWEEQRRWLASQKKHKEQLK